MKVSQLLEARSKMKSRYTLNGASANVERHPRIFNYYNIWDLKVPKNKRGKGIGSKLMKIVLDDADKNGVVLFLSPGAFGDSDLSDKDLERWYSSLGFKKVKSAGGIMKREPKIISKRS